MKIAEDPNLAPAEQLSALLDALTALRNGDPGARLPCTWQGIAGKVAERFNEVVEQNAELAAELARLRRVVGKEGRLKQRAVLHRQRGFWGEAIDHVNALIDDLVHPTSEVARVIGAVAQGDLSKSMALVVEGRPLEGEFLRTATTINTMVEQLGNFSTEVTRVAREVGTEGKLGGQAAVTGVAGTWKDLTDSVNSMAGNLTAQVRNIADVTTAVAQGDLSKKIDVEVKGEFLTLKNTINTMVDQLRSFASEVTRVAREVGTEGSLGGQARVEGASGTWKDLTDSVNSMAGNLTSQVRNIAEVTTAVAAGDLSKKITVDVKGEILELKNTINTMVDQLRSFAAEVTRVAREVGTEGKLGGQADVQGVAGTWKDLTESVNSMAGNLTSQVRNIAEVTTAVAAGDLSKKITVPAKGEIASLAGTIHSMTATLATFAEQVTTVAREVGVEGKLGGQAKVPGAAGTWKGLTENVNQLAANLTTQVRAIAEVATAVTQGDLTRSITVQAQGEVAALKDTINEMIRNLKDTTQKNTEQDWLKTNLAKFSRLLQGQRDLVQVGRTILAELAPVVGAQQAEFYVMTSSAAPRLQLFASYASGGQATHGKEIGLGEGLVGQCALDKEKILLSHVPGHAFRVASGLSDTAAMDVLVLPIVFEGQVRGVLELASLERFNPTHQAFLDQLTESIGIVIHTIEANTRTEDLLTQSQSLAQELQSRQQELQQTNLELQEKALLLAHQNHEVERKNSEVEQARQALEEKAEQLALTSKYKSEFLANMSHELRTPLNSLLILSDQLCRNAEGNLSPRQVEFAKTIHSSGHDLLMLINDILDLSKIESGTVVMDVGELRLDDLQRSVERSFRPFADSKHLGFAVELVQPLPRTLVTDAKRLQQIIKNLLSNAFKFTHHGGITCSIATAQQGWSADHDGLNRAPQVLAFSVSDTGIGISPDKQQIIFEAFQQADGSTSRKYGGTGLGLAISRELSRLLGGEIRLVSAPGHGSTFTLYLPQVHVPTRVARSPGRGAGAEPGPAAPPPTLLAAAPLYLPADEEPAGHGFSNPAGDDRDEIGPDDTVLLIVENDPAVARGLLETARQRGFKGLVSPTGAGALALAQSFHPTWVVLDLQLPDMSGWRILDRLKADLATRHLPVCMLCDADEHERALQAGAMACIAPVPRSPEGLQETMDRLCRLAQRPAARLRVVLPDGPVRRELLACFGEEIDVQVIDPGDAAAPGAAFEEADVWVTQDDSSTAPAPDHRDVPRSGPRVAVHFDPARDSASALIDRCSAALHRSLARMGETERQAAMSELARRRPLAGRKALIVDDDMRNIFALATVLDDHGMVIVSADNGRDAVALVRQDPGIEVVLMDVMMPEMDGLTTTREIRRLPHGHDLPVVAVTAKAMKGDRQKCIDAGAWDYVSKPVDPEHLLAVLRGWLHAP